VIARVAIFAWRMDQDAVEADVLGADFKLIVCAKFCIINAFAAGGCGSTRCIFFAGGFFYILAILAEFNVSNLCFEIGYAAAFAIFTLAALIRAGIA